MILYKVLEYAYLGIHLRGELWNMANEITLTSIYTRKTKCERNFSLLLSATIMFYNEVYDKNYKEIFLFQTFSVTSIFFMLLPI